VPDLMMKYMNTAISHSLYLDSLT